ncbi:CHAT domain-containing protein [Planktothrix sp. FACHB-1355]|uniref:CHAT domain-containing protein n=1 Tax=Aerosakkonema funiforme FACHB-1375 TaxID=2949571 RepID=A0A926ZFP6_9CYAN|nr:MULTISPECIES: CHAT domain-containing protein [Oscillatoriales]MBD2181070.1 CHAT domain-containing protein [Aerosakkonema funiforme FACHB-1375]MBD3558826.1 CHAT domain-containing protein [Planktothrix sp. FACHB-1355]
MRNNQTNFNRKLKNNRSTGNWLKVVKRLYRRRLLIVAALLFVLSLGLPSIVAQVSAQIPIVQSQPSGLQLVQQAKRSYEIRDFGEAARTWQQAASTFAAAGDILNQAMALSNLSLTYQQLAEWDKAEEAIAQSLNLLQTQQNTPEKLRILAQSLDIQGQLQLTTGQTETAIETWQKAANTYERMNEKERMAQSLLNLAQAQQDLGLYPRSCKILLQALEVKNIDCEALSKATQSTPEKPDYFLSIFEALPDSPTKATGLRLLGDFLRVSGNLDRSQKVLQLSLEVAQNLSSPIDENEAQLSLGNTARAQPDANKALEYYQQAATSTFPTIKIQAQLNQLSLLIENRGRLSEAQALWPQIEPEITKLPASRESIYARINLAQSLICLKQQAVENETPELSSPVIQQCNSLHKESKETKKLPLSDVSSLPKIDEILDKILSDAFERAQKLKDRRASAYAFGYRGAVYQQRGDLPKAEEFTRQALSLTSSIKAPDVAYRWQWQLGRLLQTQAEEKSKSTDADRGAIAAYTSAFRNLQSLRGDLVSISPEVQFNFRDSIEPLYREFVDLLLRPDEPSQENLKQAREAIEALQLAELNDFFRDACLDAKPEILDKVVDETKPLTAIFYAIILKERLEVVLKLPKQDKLQHYRTRIPQNEVENILLKLREYLSDVATTASDVNSLSQKVYDWLIRPRQTKLAESEVKTLVFVLDGLLRNIPMAVLYDADNKEYLVQKYPIALTPGLQLLSPRPLRQNKLSAITAGISERRKFDDDKEFEALPNVPTELKRIQSTVPRSQLLLNQDFIKTNLQKQIETAKFNIVHIATHGQFSSNPEETFILTWDKLLKVRELDQLLRINRSDNSVPIELLILSACETAAGDNRATLGLAGVAVRAGARSTLATLWPVNDESTSEFMSQLYRQLINGNTTENITKAEALQKAQIAMLTNQEQKDWKLPYYWAAYVLVGNWL